MTKIEIRTRGGACIPWTNKAMVAKATRDLTQYIASGPPGSDYRDVVTFYQKDQRGLLVPVQYINSNDQWRLMVHDCRDTPAPFTVPFVGELRAEQVGVVHRALATIHVETGTTLVLPTGSGKTVCALKVARDLGVKPLILVHKTFLMEQWRQRARQFFGSDVRVSLIQGSQYDDSGDIVIGMMQTMFSRNYVAPTSCGLVIVDECHHVPAKTFRSVMMNCNTKYRLGLSATPDRPDGLHPSTILGRVTGLHPSLPDAPSPGIAEGLNFDGSRISVETYDYISPAYSQPPPRVQYTDRINHAAMLNTVAADTRRTRLVAALIRKLPPKRHVLVLCHRRVHGTELERHLRALDVDCAVFTPKSDGCPESRVVISTYMYASEGFDEKRFDTLVLASPASDIRQSVGRILRKMDDPDHAPLVIDIVDQWSVFKKQYMKRRTLYRSMGCTQHLRKFMTPGESTGQPMFLRES